ncbi:type I secretion membrane fusion protein, HlyD family [Magnetococcus marinus MC-1]|uniref:Membrane fusion protein (MFP) family protein n=1 Tax=Magnetococcus marinus (strain ATCC BAA-1437 / JCM 17883 / MC-1) TaxID=156889 RepID=A0LBY4_MAGMM|nr:HlyD family type I secretion periplasmic adaptor subunit [Magnetococcus marinus]ABK45477.1 type I secretion membrane fusion protein, HlyD family [Magnetococcus marinus MC-1]
MNELEATPFTEEALDPKNAPGGSLGLAGWIYIPLFFGFVISLGVWAYFGVLDVVTFTTGEVVPSSQIKHVQHLEGGILRVIHVKEGEEVKLGQPLIELESIADESDLSELTARMVGLQLDIIRHDAAAKLAAHPDYPPELVSKYPQLVKQSRALFEARASTLHGEKVEMLNHYKENESLLGEIRARLRNSRERMKFLHEQVKISENLLKDELTSRLDHLALLRQERKLQSDIDEDEAGITGQQSKLRQIENGIQTLENRFVEQAKTEADKARQTLSELSHRLRKFDDRAARTILRAPANGVVKAILNNTVGGVVGAGETVMDIVPMDDRLIVEGHLSPGDVGHVQIGQKGYITLASREGVRYGRLNAEVVHISPDTFTNERNQQTYYKVRMQTEGSTFVQGKYRYELYPGVQVTAAIRTSERRVIDYFLEPLMLGQSRALRER